MRRLLLALIALTTLSCGATQSRGSSLRESVSDFAGHMRWGRIERAAEHVPDDTRIAFIRQKRLAQAQVQIHEYDVRAVQYKAGTDSARVLIGAVWSRQSDPVTHENLLEQEWRWQDQHWVMARQLEVQASESPIKPGDAL